jgi:hypothetical protein
LWKFGTTIPMKFVKSQPSKFLVIRGLTSAVSNLNFHKWKKIIHHYLQNTSSLTYDFRKQSFLRTRPALSFWVKIYKFWIEKTPKLFWHWHSLCPNILFWRGKGNQNLNDVLKRGRWGGTTKHFLCGLFRVRVTF